MTETVAAVVEPEQVIPIYPLPPAMFAGIGSVTAVFTESKENN